MAANSTVLQIGGQYGTISCEIAELQHNSGHLVAVEADKNVWGVLHFNQLEHKCSFTILFGTVGKSPFALFEKTNNYQATIIVPLKSLNQSSDIYSAAKPLPYLTLRNVEDETSFHFDTLVINCHRCINDFFAENWKHLQGINTIIMEDTETEVNRDCFANLLSGQTMPLGDFKKVCMSLRPWLRHLLELTGFKLIEVKLEQEYDLSLIPSAIYHHYVFGRQYT